MVLVYIFVAGVVQIGYQQLALMAQGPSPYMTPTSYWVVLIHCIVVTVHP